MDGSSWSFLRVNYNLEMNQTSLSLKFSRRESKGLTVFGSNNVRVSFSSNKISAM